LGPPLRGAGSNWINLVCMCSSTSMIAAWFPHR
jgi:hypothetical protein